MNKAAVYMRYNYQAQKDFLYLTRKYFKKINFKENCNVMDIGCGPGDITKHSLLPRLPKSTKSLVGVDVSSDMINFAKMYHQNDKRISYEELDISTTKLPAHFHGNFDHIFSFYCLQFAPDIKKAMENVHMMLKPNGDILCNLMAKINLYDTYDYLIRKDKWKNYLQEYKGKIALHQNTGQFTEYFKNVLKEVGFQVNIFDEERKVMIYTKETFLGIMKAISHVNLPANMEEEFALDQFEAMKNMDKVFINDFSAEDVHYSYTLISVQATKF